MLEGQITGEVGLVPENYLTLIESDDQRAEHHHSISHSGDHFSSEHEEVIIDENEQRRWTEDSKTPMGERKEHDFTPPAEASSSVEAGEVKQEPVTASAAA